MTPRADAAVRDGIRRRIAREEETFVARQPRSAELTRRARDSMPAGVPTSRHVTRPQPFWIDRGRGSRLWDVDGNEYVDMHGGHGAMLVGHAHPDVVAAAVRRLRDGTHFGQPTVDAIAVSERLAAQYGLPLWRYMTSGTEATHDAVRLMRAFTGRRHLIKAEGGYHGHHDSVMVSSANRLDELGERARPASPQSGAGLLPDITRYTRVAEWGDLDAVERIIAEVDGDVAGIIVEPVLMNFGLVPPPPGYLEGLRALADRHGVLLAFDEVKSGFTIGPGGATGLLGVRPDLVCLAKAFGGGSAIGAVGGTAEVMAQIAEGRYLQVGTFNGNPLQMATARAALEALDDDAYARIAGLAARLERGLVAAIDEHRLPVHVAVLGAKGILTFAPDRVRTYRDFLSGVDQDAAYWHWLHQHNHGVFLPPWAAGQPWLISLQHAEPDIDRVVHNFRGFAGAYREVLAGAADRSIERTSR